MDKSDDALGRLVAKTGAGSVPAFYGYDALSRMTNLVDGDGNRTLFAYDSMGHLVRKTYADGSFYQYGYNARGWLTNRVDALNRVTGYQYDPAGQLLRVDYPTDPAVVYRFDNAGRMTNRVDAAGTWTWNYDGESRRILSEICVAGSETTEVAYAYVTNTCDLASVSCGSHTTLYAWAAGRLTDVAWQAGAEFQSVRYAYQENSDLLSETSNQAFQVRREYDPADRLTRIDAANAAGLINSFSYALDSVGRRTARSDANGSRLDWNYDGYDQVTSASRTNGLDAAADAAYHFRYQYDEVGNRLHEDRGLLDLDGGFNALNQLTGLRFGGRLDVVGTVTTTNPPATVKVDGALASLFNGTNYWGGARVAPGSNAASIVAYDAASNRTETLRTFWMPPANPQPFVYDRNGNLTNDGQRVYLWDEENRLVAVETTGMSNLRCRSEYRYDGQGRRVRKVDYSGWSGSAYAQTNVTRFVWDGWNVIAELVPSAGGVSAAADGVGTNFYTWGLDLSSTLQGAGGIGGLLCRVLNGTNLLYTFDGNGNVADVLDTTAAVVAHYEYDPFGRTVVASGPLASANPWRFSTKQLEPSWNLYYYGLRFYSANLARWISRESMGENVKASSPYSFCLNNALSGIASGGTDGRKPNEPKSGKIWDLLVEQDHIHFPHCPGFLKPDDSRDGTFFAYRDMLTKNCGDEQIPADLCSMMVDDILAAVGITGGKEGKDCYGTKFKKSTYAGPWETVADASCASGKRQVRYYKLKLEVERLWACRCPDCKQKCPAPPEGGAPPPTCQVETPKMREVETTPRRHDGDCATPVEPR